MEYFGLDYLASSHQRVFWLYIVSALALASLFLIFAPKTREEYKKRKIWSHTSALMDYKYFVVVAFIKVVFILPLILSSKDVALYVTLFMQDHIGFVAPLSLSKEKVVILYTLSLFVVGDFTRYWLHRAMHSVPLLWRFHKVHHSAEVLNPLTFYRVHPVENVLFGLRYALSVGFVTGVFLYYFGAKIGVIQIVGANLFVFIFGILGANLRHSHIPLRYGDVLEKIFISPYQHQLHHTKELSTKNFGGALALWDWLFETLHIEKTRTHLEYGLAQERVYKSVLEMLYRPFCKGAS
ncbi:MAG: sterol desaturase family protein [Campylobacterales bacterium]|nr:sterol desaturase family protein [Campylobacterales bacterium]